VWVFLAVDCPVSNRSVPALRRLAETYSTKGIPFLGVFSARGTTTAALAQWKQDFAPGFPLELDSQRRKMKQAQASRTPEAVVWRNGNVHYRGRIDNRVLALGKESAEATENHLRDAIEAAIAGRAVPQPWPAAIGCYL
jgi:hypothetical protein